MAKWKKVKLGDIAFITSSKRIFAREYQNEGIPFYRGKEIIEKHKGNAVSTELFISRERYEEIKNKFDVPRPGDILLSSVGTLGVPWLVDEEEFYFKDGNLTWLRCNDKTTPEFLYLWLNSAEAQNQIDAKCIGSTQKALTIDTLNKFEVTLPPIDVQAKICDAIIPIDKKIEINRKINNNLYAQARVIARQWVAENEGNYKLMPLADIALINSDTYSPKEQWEYVNYLDTSNITDGYIAEIQYIVPSSEKLPSRARRKIMPNDIVYSTVRPNQKHFGIISKPMQNMLCSTGFAVIRSKNPTVCNELIYLYLTESEFVEKMQQLAEQSVSTFPSIKPSDLGICEIPCPKENTANSLTATLKSMFTLISANQQENVSLVAMRDSLLPKLMSGEIDISNIQI